MADPLLEVTNLRVHLPVAASLWPWGRRQYVRAVDDVSFELRAGETLGIVGESGCGKSTLLRALLQLVVPTDGQILWLGEPVANDDSDRMLDFRRDCQIVFQDPFASLDPRMTAASIIAEPLRSLYPELPRNEIDNRVEHTMHGVGLPADLKARYPHEFSIGQCQRIGIARALIVRPSLIVCDEPVSALDVSVQAQIINLLKRLRTSLQLSMIFVSHDLAVVRLMSDRILVLYLGKVMEIAARDDLFAQPRHPYTRALLAAIPQLDPDKRQRPASSGLGEIPSPINPPSGCVFRTRCRFATEICAGSTPKLERVTAEHQVACHHWREVERSDE